MAVLSFFRNAQDTLPVHSQDLNWEQIKALLGKHDIRESKDGPAFSPAIFDGPRSARGVRSLSLAVLDFDHVSEEQLDDLDARLSAGGLAYVLYTTFSHCVRGAGDLCFRLVLPLSRECSADEWTIFYPRLIAALGGAADPKVRDPSRLFYLPNCPETRAGLSLVDSRDGAPIDVAAILARPDDGSANAGLTIKVTRDMLGTIAKGYRASRDPFRVSVGHALGLLVKGEPFAEPGERDNAIYAISIALAEAFPDADPRGISVLFGPSLSVMGADCPTVAMVEEKIGRKQREVRAVRGVQGSERSKRILGVFRNGRDYGYTAEEIATFGDIAHRWILVSGDDYWIFFSGEYLGPFRGKHAEHAVLDWLSPATHIPLIRATKEGQLAVPLRELVLAHGETIRTVRGSLFERTTKYRAEDRTLVESICTMRELVPCHDPDIARWIQVLGGERLIDWLAVLPRLDMSAPALFLCGPPGVGKSLLAAGCSRLWSEGGASSMFDVLGGNFNEALAQCPFVFADESIPTDPKGGKPRTEELRDLITRQTQPLRRKYRPTIMVDGAVRCMIAANDSKTIFGNAVRLSPNDIRAIAERFIYLCPDPAARTLLEELGPETIDTWVKGDKIARHVLYLAGNRYVPRGRLACMPHMGRMLAEISVSTGLRWEVLHWIVSYLIDPVKHLQGLAAFRGQRPACVVQAGSVWIRAEELWQYWGNYSDQSARPARHSLFAVVKDLTSTGERMIAGSVYRQLPLDLLVDWSKLYDSPLPSLDAFEKEQIRKVAN